MFVNKRFLLVGTVCISLFFASCKKDDEDETYYGAPDEIIDEDHVSVDDRYGITAICGKGEWTNSYVDTMPEKSRDYYADYLYNSITLGLYKDSFMITEGVVSYPSQLVLMRFLKNPIAEEDADAFKKGFKETAYDNLITAYYESVDDMRDTTINGYPASYFSAYKGYNQSAGLTEVYMMYYNGTMYAATINLVIGHSDEDSYNKCMEVLNTVKLK